MASIDRVMALAEELKKKKKDKDYEISQSTINTLDLANDLRSGNKETLTTYLDNNKDFDAPIRNIVNNKDEEDDSWLKKGAFEDGVDGVWDFATKTAKTILGTAGDVAVGAAKGIGNLAEGVVDLGSYAVSGLADLAGADDFSDDAKKFAQKNMVNNWLDPYQEKLDKNSILGDKADNISQGLGYVGGIILTGGLGAAAGLGATGTTILTTGVTGLAGMGSGMSEAYQGGATDKEAVTYGTISGLAEAGTELLFGGLGKAVNATGLSYGISSLDDALAKKVASKFSSQIAKNFAEYGIKAAAEGSEEVLAGFIQGVGKYYTYQTEQDGFNLGQILEDERLLDQFITGAVTSGIAQSGLVPGMNNGSLIEANKSGRDFITGFTQNEQAVVDAEVARRTEGQTLTNKQKSKIVEEVKEDLQKGYISTDTIESTLGGDTYNTLKSVRDNKTNLETQIKELESKPNAEITVKEMEQLNSLREQLKTVDTNTLETQLQSEMGSRIKSDNYLQRSYQEKAKRSKEFTYEAAETDSEFRRGVMESTKGKLNDTTRSHETAEALVKLSEDRKMQYKFTNNAELKEMGLTKEGKTANGLYVVEKDGTREILVNTDSKKYVEAVLVHETTHDFQNTSPETYTKLVDITKQFAEAQQDYARVYSEVAGMYKGVENANIQDEVTARLLEDYLGNKDFVSNLTTKEPNIVKKIIDEIKYLVKKFTAGSPEARKLVELQHELEKTYREAYKQTKTTETTEGTKYSVSEVDSLGRELSKKQLEYFKDSKVRDADGNLLVMYHGTRADFNEFDMDRAGQNYEGDWSAFGKGFYFTPNQEAADDFSSAAIEGNSKNVKEVYLNITNPFYTENNYSETLSNLKEKYNIDDTTLNKGYRLLDFLNQNGYDSTKVLQELGYDGVLDVYNGKIEEAVAFKSNQIKNTDNTKPTESADIRYSLSDYQEYTNELNDILEKAKNLNEQFYNNLKSQQEEYRERHQLEHNILKETDSRPATNENINSDFFKEHRSEYDGNSGTKTADGTLTVMHLQKGDNLAKLSFTEGEDKIWIDELYVKNQKQGYGSEIVNAIKKYAKENGKYVEAFKELSTAKGFWDKTLRDNAKYSLSEDMKSNSVIDFLDPSKLKEIPKQIIVGPQKLLYEYNSESNSYDKVLTEPHYQGYREPLSQYFDYYGGILDEVEIVDNPDTKYSLSEELDNYLESNEFTLETNGNMSYKTLTNKQITSLASAYKKSGYTDVTSDYLKSKINNSIRFKIPREVADVFIEKELGYKPQIDTTQVYEDAEGNPLTKEQVEFFKNSNVRDIRGRLIPVYHRTNADFTVFDNKAGKQHGNKYGKGFYFSITPENYGNREIKAYLNAKEGEYKYIPSKGYYVVQIKNQIKSVDNLNPTENDDINLSLSNESDIAPTNTPNQTSMQDIRLQVEEAIAPLQEEITALREQINPTSESIQPDERAESPVIAEKSPVTTVDYAPATQEVVEQQNREAFNTLDDIDSPQQVEDFAPTGEKLTPTESLFETRDYAEVGNKNINAYQYDNPEVRPYFQQAAREMMSDLDASIKGERYIIGDNSQVGTGDYYYSGNTRHTTEDIAELLDGIDGKYKYSYAEIRKGLQAIIEDNGKENNAASKRIEFYLDKRLREGYTDIDGYTYPADEGYLDVLRAKGISDYYSNLPIGDAPIEDASNTEVIKEIAPVREQYEAIEPRPTETIKPQPERTSEPRMKRVSTNPETDGLKQRRWVETSTESDVVNREILPSDLDQSKIMYQPISNKATLGKANARIDGLGYEGAVAYFNGQITNNRVTVDDIALGERLIQEAMKRGDTKTAGELIQNVAILGTELGQKVQALSIIQRMTPEGQLKMLQKTIDRGKVKGDKAFEGIELTQEMIDHILKTYNQDGTYDQKELNKAVEDVKQQIADNMKVTTMEKVNAWRYLAMLGNPKTHIRNLVSNVAMRGTLKVKNALARTIETVAPVKNRTKTWKKSSDVVKNYAKETTLDMKEILSDDNKYNEDTSIKAKRDTFKTKILNNVYNFNSDLLSKEDWWFSRPAFENSFAEYLTANGIETETDIKNNPKIIEKAKLYATEQAQIATFRQYSWLANKIRDIEHKNTATQIAVGSVIPFKKTPINIAKTGLAYSPLGFAKTLTYDIAQVKKGNMEASTLVDHIAQNTTGTALTLIGYMLASAGFLNGGGDDDKESKYDYQLGKQSYSLNIGGNTYSLSWLSPVAIPMFVGANAYEQLVEGKEWTGDLVVETLAQTLDPLSEMSFLSGLDTVLSSYDSGFQKFAGIGESMIQNYATQFVPTFSSQVASTLDDTKRTTKVAGDSDFKFFDETVNKLIYKIPFLRETLEPSTDIWGNEVKQNENMFNRALENFIAPYARKESIATEIDEELKELYRETGDNGVIPNIPYNYVNYEGEKYKMSAKEYTDFKKTYGQTANEMLEELFDTTTYGEATSEDRVDMVNKVFDYARDEAKREYLDKEGVEYTNAEKDGVGYYKENNIKGAIDNDMTLEEFKAYSENPSKYAVATAITDYSTYKKLAKELYDIKADKDANGKTISGSRKEKVFDYINNLNLDFEQRVMLAKLEYPTYDEYNYEIIEYLNNRDDISYAQMVSILTELGFTVDANGNVSWD